MSSRLRNLVSLWFGSAPLDRPTYAIAGAVAVGYLVNAAAERTAAETSGAVVLSMRSKRGEFRLVPQAGGGTRLEGSTWYELEMSPGPYWTLWSDALVHAIHTRVLAHIKRLAEADVNGLH